MKTLFTTILIVITITAATAQDSAVIYYQKGMLSLKGEKYEEAISLFNRSLQLKDSIELPIYFRALCEKKLNHYEEALVDFNLLLNLFTPTKQNYLNRGECRMHLTNYTGAMDDLNKTLSTDNTYGEAYYYRGVVHDMFAHRDSACKDFKLAYDFGFIEAHKKVEHCKDTAAPSVRVHAILRLTTTATTTQYGYDSISPIKVGMGPDDGPANERAYLELLRDAQGKPVKYTRVSSCCQYASPNGFMGYAMIDVYEIKYNSITGTEQTAKVYFTFYDYDEPMILEGLKTISDIYTK